jgi:hypothetical protein
MLWISDSRLNGLLCRNNPKFYCCSFSMFHFYKHASGTMTTQELSRTLNKAETPESNAENLAPEDLHDQTYKNRFRCSGYFVITHNQVESSHSDGTWRDTPWNNCGRKSMKTSVLFSPKNKTVDQGRVCVVCNTHKYERRPNNIKISPRCPTEKPMMRAHLDIFAINSYNCLSMVDSFSKFAQMIPIESFNLIN